MSELSLVDVEVARSFVVDGDRRIVESTVAELPAGDMLTPSSWLGQACLDAIDAAAASRSVVRSVARDCLRGTVW
ncbi:hypothetical protein C1X78_25830, partial [Pseudomonas sp. MPR-R1B]|uniref:hypothetical protein n=1 Tax=Pseudomonas sp. MPR-R1B TaxID=2070678 RepID=UPI000CBFB051